MRHRKLIILLKLLMRALKLRLNCKVFTRAANKTKSKFDSKSNQYVLVFWLLIFVVNSLSHTLEIPN